MPSNMGRFQRKDAKRRDRALTVSGPVQKKMQKHSHDDDSVDETSSVSGGLASQEWLFETQGQITLLAVNPSGGELYAHRDPANGERIYGVLTSDGSQKWDVSGPNTGWDLVASPDGNHIYHTDNQDVVKLDISDGSEVWRSNGGSSDAKYGLAVSPDSSTVYAVTTDSLRVIDASDGSSIRAESTEFTGTRRLEISPDGSKLFMAEAFSSEVKAVDPSNGSTLWTYTGHSGNEENHDLDVSHDGSFVCSCNNNGEVHAINANDGSSFWAYPGFSNSVNRVEIAPSDAMVYAVSSGDGEAHAIDASDGSGVGSPYTGVGYPLTLEVATDSSAVFIGGSPEGQDSSSGVIHRVDVDDPPEAQEVSVSAGTAIVPDGSSSSSLSHGLTVDSGSSVVVVALPRGDASVWCPSRTDTHFTLERSGTSGSLQVDYIARAV